MSNNLIGDKSVQTSFQNIKHLFTPIISGNYSFLLQYGHSCIWSVLDNFELKEGYTNLVNGNNTSTFDFDGTLSNDIILESSANSITQIIDDTATSDNKLVKMTGSNSNSNSNWNSFGNIWENNQNSISKINAKVNATNASSLFMKFDLNQTHLNSSTDSKFRVLINGNVIDEISATSFNRNSNSSNNVYEYNLTQYVGADIRISLQHIGKNIGDDAFFDNLIFSPTQSLSINQYENNSIEYFPNPVLDLLNIKSKNEINKYEIFDINSRLIDFENVNKQEYSIDTSKFSSGIYFVKLFDNEGVSKEIKFIKK